MSDRPHKPKRPATFTPKQTRQIMTFVAEVRDQRRYSANFIIAGGKLIEAGSRKEIVSMDPK